jgi:hypothetical protein
MRISAIVLGVGLVLAGACGKSAPAGKPIPERCEADGECPERWRCLAHKCTDPSLGAHFTDPEHALTPERMKQQVDQTNEAHEKDVDKKVEEIEK